MFLVHLHVTLLSMLDCDVATELHSGGYLNALAFAISANLADLRRYLRAGNENGNILAVLLAYQLLVRSFLEAVVDEETVDDPDDDTLCYCMFFG